MKISRLTPLLALFIALAAPRAHAQDSFVRLLHGLSLVGKVDVTVDGEKKFNDFDFSRVTPYFRLDAGSHSFLIQTNNPTRTVARFTRSFAPYDFHTLGFYGSSRALKILNANDSRGNPPYGRAQLTVYNLSPGAAPFDVVTFQPGGDTLVLARRVRYGVPKRVSVPARAMTVRLVRRGAILKTITGNAPRAGRKYALYAVGREGRNFRAMLDVTASQ